MNLLTAVHQGGLVQWLADHETVAVWTTGIFTALLAIGVFIAWSALYDAKKTRHAELIGDFSQRYDDKEIIDSAKLARQYGSENLVALCDRLFGDSAPDFSDPTRIDPREVEAWNSNYASWLDALKWPDLLETIGVMIRHRALRKDMAYQMWGGPIITAWSIWAAAVRAHRNQMDDNNIFRYFEWLAGEMEKARAADKENQALAALARQSGPLGAAISAASSLGRAAATAGSSGSRPPR